MIERFSRFNPYLAGRRLSVCLVITLLVSLRGAGCSTLGGKGKNEEASLRLHLEVNPAGGIQGTNVIIGRESPFSLTVDRQPFLSEFNMEWAKLVDTIGGFSI